MKGFKVLVFLLSLALGSFVFGDNVKEGLKKISFFDRYCMKLFFEKAIKRDLASHLLFSNSKPVCNICIPIKYPDKTFKTCLVLRGWHAFKENEYLFPHPNFIFVDYYYGNEDDFRFLGIDMINKEPLRACLNRHKRLFQEVLGSDFTPDEFISQLERGVPLSSLLNNDDMLLGIALGYGEESPRAFKEMMTKYSEGLPPPQTETYQRIDLKTPEGCKISPVVFMGNPHCAEVKELAAKYETELAEFWPIYKKSKKPLKTVLEKLCEAQERP